MNLIWQKQQQQKQQKTEVKNWLKISVLDFNSSQTFFSMTQDCDSGSKGN